MFKRGICTIDELLLAAEPVLKQKRFLPNCYIGLYEDVILANGAVDGRLQELILSPFAVRDGVFKRTANKRFGEFDTRTLEVLREAALLRSSCVVHDMAASDARTACHFFDKLAAEFGTALDFYATDLCFKVYSIRRPCGRLTVVIDEDQRILQVVLPPFVLTIPKKDRWLFSINSVVRTVLLHTAVKQLMSLYQSYNGSVERREILLLSGEAREHLHHYLNFHIERYDALQPSKRKYGVVRAMNIFNRRYFPDYVLTKAVRNVLDSLNEDGVFVTGSNQDAGSMVNGTIYRKCGDRFIPLYQSAQGSPIDYIIAG